MKIAAPGRAPPARGAILAVVMFVLGIAAARMILEPSGTGMIVFFIALPFLVLVSTILVGFGTALVVVSIFAASAWTVRIILLGTDGGWVLLLLVPVFAMTVFIMVRTTRVLVSGLPEATRGEEEEE